MGSLLSTTTPWGATFEIDGDKTDNLSLKTSWQGTLHKLHGLQQLLSNPPPSTTFQYSRYRNRSLPFSSSVASFLGLGHVMLDPGRGKRQHSKRRGETDSWIGSVLERGGRRGVAQPLLHAV